jgi:ABC-type branched-subunit amino acid transport system substrate-binding protein
LPIANRLFQPEPEDYPIFDKFVEEFYDEYSDYPDIWSTVGYKSIKLLIHGIMETNSVASDAVNDYLEFHNKSMGVTGPNRYNSKGELESPEIYFNTYFNGNLKRLIIPDGEIEIVKLGLETG